MVEEVGRDKVDGGELFFIGNKVGYEEIVKDEKVDDEW